ncbi:MAG: hypothetical protein AAFN93_09315 [Bacteroidota bacterium]
MTRHIKPLFFICFLFIALQVNAQEFEFQSSIRMDSTINSEAEEVKPLVSPSGDKLYFARAFHEDNIGGRYAGLDIWVSGKQGGEDWAIPSNDSIVWNDKDGNVLIGIRQDDIVVYLSNTHSRQRGIQFSKKLNAGWTEPEVIKIPNLAKGGVMDFYMTPDYTTLIVSMIGDNTEGQEDLYVSRQKNGEWSPLTNLGATVNTPGFEISPFLSADKKYLFFSSDGHDGLGQADIFVSKRLYDSWDVWTQPVNLGDNINSDKFDAYFSVAPDSSVYYTSNRQGGFADIYKSKIIGVKKDYSKELVKKLIDEAKNILADIRQNSAVKNEYFIKFQYNSKDMGDEGKLNLANLVRELNYSQYSEINLINFNYNGINDKDLYDSRLDAVVNYLVLSGIDERKIIKRNADELVTDADEYVIDESDGVLIITNN